MKQKVFFLVLLALMVVASGCTPKIIGKRKHKKIRGCGCEWPHIPVQTGDSARCFAIHQVDEYSLQHFDGQNPPSDLIGECNKN